MTPPQASEAAVGGPTPGPWKAVFNNWSRYEIHYAGGQLAMVARWDDPASPPPIPEMHANARLIAAAPELLETLEEMVRWYAKREPASMTVSGGEGLLPIEQQDEEVQQAMRAIAKATP